MEADFWHERWENNQIAFHEGEANPLLVKHFKALSLEQDQRVFLPLCGKTNDIAWLLSQGYRVVGSELSELAIQQLFEELEVEPEITELDKFKLYQITGLEIFVGDFFELTGEILGHVDAIYDRAALVALPEPMRKQYTKHLVEITENQKQLVISFVYDQTCLNGPPFSVSNEEVNQHYADIFELTLLESIDVPGGLKKKCAAVENIWLLE